MAEEGFDIFVHAQGEKPKVVVAKDGDILRDILIHAGVLRDDDKDVLVFVGEDEDQDGADDGDDDQQDPADPRATVKALDLLRRRHVHCSRCRRIVVEVHFLKDTKTRKFAPSATAGRVTKWARCHFTIDKAAADEYVLQICGTQDQPRPDVHLGELVKKECALCFNLVKEVTPQG